MSFSLIIKFISIFLIGVGAFIIIYFRCSAEEISYENEKKAEQFITNEKIDNNSSEYDALIEIPSINLKTIIYNGNKSMSVINKGVSFMYKTSMPDSGNLTVLMGHSGNSLVSYFKNINKLEGNDLIIIHYKKKKYNYYVKSSYIIDQYDTDILKKEISNGLMLITCLSGNDKKRLVVEANY